MQSRVDETIADDLDVDPCSSSTPASGSAPATATSRSRVFELGVPGRDRRQQDRPAQAGAHRRADEDRRRARRTSTRSTRSAPRPATASTSSAPTSSRCSPRARCSTRPARSPTCRSRRGSPSSSASRRCTLTREEVPHALTAEVVEIDDGRVHVRLYTETESQKQILIGKGGSMVREIGRGAPRHRGAARPQDLPPAAGEGLAEVAAERDDARAARPLTGGQLPAML